MQHRRQRRDDRGSIAGGGGEGRSHRQKMRKVIRGLRAGEFGIVLGAELAKKLDVQVR